MAATCRTWETALTRDAAAARALLRQLPVLFFPSADGPAFSCLSCGGALHDLAGLLPDGITEARVIGSRPSWCWFAATGYSKDHLLCNMASGDRIQIPDSMRIGYLDRISTVQILAATVSATPNAQVPAALCYGAALVKRGVHHDVMFWRLDHQMGLGSRIVALDWARGAADVIYHNGVFKFLAQDGRLVCVKPGVIADGDRELRADVWAPIVDVPLDVLADGDMRLCACYLVLSRNQLLMVKRYTVLNDWWTQSFRVYQLEQLHLGQSPEEDHFRWVELTELNGRILFVARGCSMAFEVQEFTDYPQAVEGVYYKGDVAEFDADTWRESHSFERSMMLSDCGRWSFPGLQGDCFNIPLQLPGTLDHSAAAWLVV